MRLFRRMSALVMVLALLLSLSISVWAADYDAASIDDLWVAFGDTSGEDVNINLTADIDGTAEGGGYNGVSGQEGINYTIGSDNGSSIGNIFVYGGESVTVDAAVEGSIHFDSVDATVNGDVDGHISAFDSEIAVDGDVAGGVSAFGESTVDVTGNVAAESGDSWVAVYAGDNATVNVGGDVTGRNGNPDNVDFSDPAGFSDGSSGVHASDNATVNVAGNVNGGTSYGTFGYGGSGIDVMGEATVNVGGNVTGGDVIADPDTIVTEDNYTNSIGGTAIYTAGSATVNVGGNVTGGSTNGSEGNGGDGITVICDDYDAEPGSVAVGGTVTTGEGQHEGTGIIVYKQSETAEVPEISAGSCDSIEGYGFTEEELEQLKADIEATYVKQYSSEDLFNDILWRIRTAKAGDEITVNVHDFKVLATAIIEAVKEVDVKLIIQWDGGDDLVIDKSFSAEIEGSSIALTDLAELLKK